MQMVPHERSLVQKQANKPFALLGVNCDNTREGLKQSQIQNQITWRSFFDGRGGPIGTQYGVRYLPTIYVLDQYGVIRYKDVRGQQMDNAVEKLLKEMGQ
jgi:hypothetical protein